MSANREPREVNQGSLRAASVDKATMAGWKSLTNTVLHRRRDPPVRVDGSVYVHAVIRIGARKLRLFIPFETLSAVGQGVFQLGPHVSPKDPLLRDFTGELLNVIAGQLSTELSRSSESDTALGVPVTVLSKGACLFEPQPELYGYSSEYGLLWILTVS